MPRASAAERARRMMALLPLLTPGAELPLGRLADVVGGTPAEVAADIATLSLCGLPPYSPDELVEAFVEGDVVCVYTAPPALERPLALAPAEAAALAAALEACGRGPDDPLRAKLLAAASAPADAAEIASAVRAAVSPGGVAAIHAAVAAATSSHEALRIEYFSAGRGEVGARVIEPWAMGVDRGVWYVAAWCRSAWGERVFRLDRIRSAEGTGETFTPPADARPPVPAFPAQEASARATVIFDAFSDVSSREWPGATFAPGEVGQVIAQVPFVSGAWVARRVAARLGSAEVVAPRKLRAEVAGLARRMLAALGES